MASAPKPCSACGHRASDLQQQVVVSSPELGSDQTSENSPISPVTVPDDTENTLSHESMNKISVGNKLRTTDINVIPKTSRFQRISKSVRSFISDLPTPSVSSVRKNRSMLPVPTRKARKGRKIHGHYNNAGATQATRPKPDIRIVDRAEACRHLHERHDLIDIAGEHYDLSEVAGEHHGLDEVAGQRHGLDEVAGEHQDLNEAAGEYPDLNEPAKEYRHLNEVAGEHHQLSEVAGEYYDLAGIAEEHDDLVGNATEHSDLSDVAGKPEAWLDQLAENYRAAGGITTNAFMQRSLQTYGSPLYRPSLQTQAIETPQIVVDQEIIAPQEQGRVECSQTNLHPPEVSCLHAIHFTPSPSDAQAHQNERPLNETEHQPSNDASDLYTGLGHDQRASANVRTLNEGPGVGQPEIEHGDNLDQFTNNANTVKSKRHFALNQIDGEELPSESVNQGQLQSGQPAEYGMQSMNAVSVAAHEEPQRMIRRQSYDSEASLAIHLHGRGDELIHEHVDMLDARSADLEPLHLRHWQPGRFLLRWVSGVQKQTKNTKIDGARFEQSAWSVDESDSELTETGSKHLDETDDEHLRQLEASIEQLDDEVNQVKEQHTRQMHVDRALARLEGTYTGPLESPAYAAMQRYGTSLRCEGPDYYGIARNDHWNGERRHRFSGILTDEHHVEPILDPEMPVGFGKRATQLAPSTRHQMFIRNVNGMTDARVARRLTTPPSYKDWLKKNECWISQMGAEMIQLLEEEHMDLRDQTLRVTEEGQGLLGALHDDDEPAILGSWRQRQRGMHPGQPDEDRI